MLTVMADFLEVLAENKCQSCSTWYYLFKQLQWLNKMKDKTEIQQWKVICIIMHNGNVMGLTEAAQEAKPANDLPH